MFLAKDVIYSQSDEKMLLSRVPTLFSHVTKVIGNKAIICALIHSCQDYTTITLKLFKKTLLKA